MSSKLWQWAWVIVCASFVAFAVACSRRSKTTQPIAAAPKEESNVGQPAGGPFGDRVIGAPRVFGRLTVFPIFSKAQTDAGPMRSLEGALATNVAKVREVSDSGSVNRLVIENDGDVPIYVLAGTVVKGGKQDRQVAQDFIVGANETTPVEAFCVEAHRWNPDRDGVLTNGSFGAIGSLAVAKVRTEAQYKGDQGGVWNEVAKTNAAAKKNAPTGTLMATLDAPDIAEKRTTIAKTVNATLTTLEPQGEIVGIGYGVDDRVVGVRWFSSHALFELFRDTLVSTAANEAAIAPGDEAAKSSAHLTVDDLKSFVTEVDAAKDEQEKPTTGINVNLYKESKSGYGSKTMAKPMATATATASASPIEVSADFVKK
jgi:hypothetical protein